MYVMHTRRERKKKKRDENKTCGKANRSLTSLIVTGAHREGRDSGLGLGLVSSTPNPYPPALPCPALPCILIIVHPSSSDPRRSIHLSTVEVEAPFSR